MTFLEKLDAAVKKNNSLLCIGLDIDLKKIPASLLNKGDPIFDFNKAIIDATKDLVCAYKPNIAFYEMYGVYGMQALIKTIEYATDHIPIILDAKRSDIGHTASAYAKAIFDIYKADATTVNPYLGGDSLEPFLEYTDKGIFVLCLTSNPGSKDFQNIAVYGNDVFISSQRIFAKEIVGEQGDVFLVLAERRQHDRDHAQSVIEVFTERPFVYRFEEVGVGCGDDTDTHFNDLVAPDTIELALLDDA